MLAKLRPIASPERAAPGYAALRSPCRRRGLHGPVTLQPDESKTFTIAVTEILPPGSMIAVTLGDASPAEATTVAGTEAKLVPLGTGTLPTGIGALESDVLVHVVCPDMAAYTELTIIAGTLKCRLSPTVVDHPMTTWSRDRWVALAPIGQRPETKQTNPGGYARQVKGTLWVSALSSGPKA